MMRAYTWSQYSVYCHLRYKPDASGDNVGIGTNLHRAVIVLNVKLYPRKVCSRVKNNPIVLTIDFDFTSEQYRIHIKQNKIITPLNLNLGVYAHAPLHRWSCPLPLVKLRSHCQLRKWKAKVRTKRFFFSDSLLIISLP